MTQPLVDFGTDVSLADDLDPTGRMVTGTRLVGEAIYRRLTTPRGSLIDDPNYGMDVRLMLSRAATKRERDAIPKQLEMEIKKDERVQTATVTVKSLDLFNWVLEIACTTGAGPFSLSVTVDQAGPKLTAFVGGSP